MKNVNKQYLIILIPFAGFAIISFLVMFRYFKHFKLIIAWFYSIVFPILYLGLIMIFRETLLYFPDDELLQIIVFYIEFMFIGFLLIITQRFILKKYVYIK